MPFAVVGTQLIRKHEIADNADEHRVRVSASIDKHGCT
jgi:hypothetical protein